MMWTEATMNADGIFTSVTLTNMFSKVRVAYLQLKDSPEAKAGARAFASCSEQLHMWNLRWQENQKV